MGEDNVTPGQSSTPLTAANQRVVDHIERILRDIVTDIDVSSGRRPVITLRRISAIVPYYDRIDPACLRWHIEDREVRYHFPGKTKEEAWRFGEWQ